MDQLKVYDVLKQHVPPGALDYCLTLWKNSPFELQLRKSRHSKVGDFTSKGTKSKPRITLNNDLNPYLFLMTYVHEVAHLYVYLKHRASVDPHGKEWQQVFAQLMTPLLWDSVFPPEILHVLRLHMVQPKASSFSDSELTRAFRKFDAQDSYHILSDLPTGTIFKIRSQYFKKGFLRRTRFACTELKSKRTYLVPADAQVSVVQFSLL